MFFSGRYDNLYELTIIYGEERSFVSSIESANHKPEVLPKAKTTSIGDFQFEQQFAKKFFVF